MGPPTPPTPVSPTRSSTRAATTWPPWPPPPPPPPPGPGSPSLPGARTGRGHASLPIRTEEAGPPPAMSSTNRTGPACSSKPRGGIASSAPETDPTPPAAPVEGSDQPLARPAQSPSPPAPRRPGTGIGGSRGRGRRAVRDRKGGSWPPPRAGNIGKALAGPRGARCLGMSRRRGALGPLDAAPVSSTRARASAGTTREVAPPSPPRSGGPPIPAARARMAAALPACKTKARRRRLARTAALRCCWNPGVPAG